MSWAAPQQRHRPGPENDAATDGPEIDEDDNKPDLYQKGSAVNGVEQRVEAPTWRSDCTTPVATTTMTATKA